MAKNVLQSTILSGSGAVAIAPGAQIEVRNPDGLLVPLWLDRDGTQPTTNPVTADSNGFFRVYLNSGRYHITARSGNESHEWRDVLLGSAAGYDVDDMLAALAAGIYTNVAEGLANTAEGDFFWVAHETGDDVLTLYRVVDGDAELWAALPRGEVVRELVDRAEAAAESAEEDAQAAQQALADILALGDLPSAVAAAEQAATTATEQASIATTKASEAADSAQQAADSASAAAQSAATAEQMVEELELGTAAKRDVTTSPTDTTPGRVLTVGAFGLGGAAAAVPGNNIDDNTIPTGFYYVTSTAYGTKPTGDDGSGHLIVSREGPGTTARQLYLDNTSARICTRVYVNTAWSEWRDIFHISETYYNTVGLVQAATGGGAGTYVRIDESFNPRTTDAAFFNNHPTYAGIIQQTIDGQSMIKIPKFYFKAGTVPSGPYAGKAYWMISDQPVPGFSVHPAFIGAGGAELDQIWVGKYKASSSGGKLQSVGGVLPVVNISFPTARQYAYARNVSGVSGFRLWSYYDLAAIQMLATIEMGGLDMQALIGQGRVSQTSAANVDAADVAQATWRGIVGLWGNVWQMVDGLKRNGGNWWRWQYNAPGSATASDFATGYVNTGRAALTSSGYPVTFDTTLLAAGIIVPATVDGTASNGSTGDYFYSNTNTSDQVAYHGGHWSNGAIAGLFCANSLHPPSHAHTGIGCRLAKV